MNIIHPVTGKQYNIISQTGLQILKEFMDQYKLGGMRRDDDALSDKDDEIYTAATFPIRDDDDIGLTLSQRPKPLKKKRKASERSDSYYSSSYDSGNYNNYMNILEAKVRGYENQMRNLIQANKSLKNDYNRRVRELVGTTDSYRDQFYDALKVNREYQDELAECESLKKDINLDSTIRKPSELPNIDIDPNLHKHNERVFEDAMRTYEESDPFSPLSASPPSPPEM